LATNCRTNSAPRPRLPPTTTTVLPVIAVIVGVVGCSIIYIQDRWVKGSGGASPKVQVGGTAVCVRRSVTLGWA
jgi:hypothetical protein